MKPKKGREVSAPPLHPPPRPVGPKRQTRSNLQRPERPPRQSPGLGHNGILGTQDQRARCAYEILHNLRTILRMTRIQVLEPAQTSRDESPRAHGRSSEHASTARLEQGY